MAFAVVIALLSRRKDRLELRQLPTDPDNIKTVGRDLVVRLETDHNGPSCAT